MKKIILDRRFWLLPVAVWTAVVAASLVWNVSVIDRQVRELSAGQGREVFRLMEAMRLWNARHGGVYVIQTPSSPPNPYLLDVPAEDVLADGRRLTVVNPAYMTRLVADTLFELTSIRVRIISLRPVNPLNSADTWEAEGLKGFEQGEKERAEIVDMDGHQVARYIAPLVTRRACMQCHTRHGYQIGDIRGGISISFPSAPFEASVAGQKRSVLLVHGVGWALVTALTLFALVRYRAQLLALERSKEHLESEVLARTAELRHEIAERRQTEGQLRRLVESSGNGLFGLSALGECTFINPVALQLLGATDPASLLGSPILERIVPAGEQLQSLHDALQLSASLYSDEVILARFDGTTFPAEIRLDPIECGDEGPAGAVVNFSDITRRKAVEATVWRQANFDPLTGLANRSLFRERLDEALVQARRSGEMLALLFLDLDGFKAINDSHGHEAGDCVLQQTGQRLSEAIRQSDLAARQSGDEFLVLLRNLGSRERAGIVAAKLLDALARPYAFDGAELEVSASIGIAVYPDDADHPDGLVRCADQAMYRAKEGGKHTYRYFSNGGPPAG